MEPARLAAFSPPSRCPRPAVHFVARSANSPRPNSLLFLLFFILILQLGSYRWPAWANGRTEGRP